MSETNKKALFSRTDLLLWGGSAAAIVLSFLLFDRESYLTLAASLVGVTSLIFNAKGNPVGQLLMIIFSFLYGIISYRFAYYGEMLTYLGMTMPMSVFALVSWLRHPYEGNRAEVQVHSLEKRELFPIAAASVVVTTAFYFLLVHFHTANIIPSTISVTTSFLAAYLTYRRTPYFAAAYAANDVVLIVLWVLASREDVRYVAVVVCFAAFFLHDLYGFRSWRKMHERQKKAAEI